MKSAAVGRFRIPRSGRTGLPKTARTRDFQLSGWADKTVNVQAGWCGHAPKVKRGKHVLKLVAFLQTAVAGSFDSLRREEGQTMAEYGVVLAVITIAVVGAISLLSGNVRAAITHVAGLLPTS